MLALFALGLCMALLLKMFRVDAADSPDFERTAAVVDPSVAIRRSLSKLWIVALCIACAISRHGCAAQSSITLSVTTIANSTQCSTPNAVYSDSATEVVYAACSGGGVIAINEATITTIATAQQCPSPYDLAFNSATGVVYAACMYGDGVIAINGSAVGPTAANSARCYYPRGLAINQVTGIVYAACSGGIIAINGSAVTTIADETQCPDPYGLAVNRITGAVYATCTGTMISILDGVVTPVSTCIFPSSSVSVNAVSGVMYAACSDGGVIAINGTTITTIATGLQCPGANDVFVDDATGVVYAACNGGGGIIAIRGNAVITIAGESQCSGPSGISFNRATGVVLAACVGGASAVIAVSAVTITTVVSPSDCLSAASVAINSATGTLYAAGNCGVLSVRGSAVATLATETQCPDLSGLAGLVVDETTGVLYVACSGGDVIAINGRTVTTIADQTQCPGPRKVVVNSATGVVYVACASDVISISGSAITTIANRTECPSPVSLSVDPVTGAVYAACLNGGIVMIHGRAVTTLANEAQCQQPTGLAFNAVSGILYASCIGSGVISIEISSSTVATIATCPSASGVAVNDVTGTVYAVCNSIGSLVIAIGRGAITKLVSDAHCSNPRGVFADRVTGASFVACGRGHTGVLMMSTDFACASGFQWSVDGCSRCALGFYRDYAMVQAAQPSCVVCPAGQVAPIAGAAACTACAPSTYALSPMISCQPCPLGTYSRSFGASTCSLCRSGSYGSAPSNSSACSGVCSAGYWCTEGSASPTQIPCGAQSVYCPSNSSAPHPVSRGYYSAHPASTVDPSSASATMTVQLPCLAGQYCDGSGLSRNCSAGSFQNRTGQANCLPCSVGTFTSDESAVQCTACVPGRWSSAGSTVCSDCVPGTSRNAVESACVLCSIGRYAAITGASSCDPCPPGQIAPSAGFAYCSSCPTGTSQPRLGQSVCVDCDPGRFASTFNSTTCEPCNQGSYAPFNGSSSCILCPQGTASDTLGSFTPCPACLPGFYQGAVGSSSCLACDARLTSNSSAVACSMPSCAVGQQFDSESLSCAACPLGQSSSGAGVTCATCPLNAYTPVAGSVCVPCSQPGMEGLTCTNGLASVKAGYWAMQVEDAAYGLELYQTFPCPEGYCPGSALQQSNVNATIEYCSFPRLNSASNLMCGGCEAGYIPWGDSCVSCTGTNGGLVFGVLVLSFALVLFLLRSGGSAAGPVAVLLFFVQTAALEVGSVSRWISWLHVFNLGAESTSACLAQWTPQEQTLFSILVPLFLLVELIIVAAVHIALRRWVQSQPQSPSSDSSALSPRSRQFVSSLVLGFDWSSYVGGGVSILLFCYTQVATACVRFLYCVDVGDARVVFTAPTVDCRSSEYQSYFGFVVFTLIVFVCGLPLAVFGLLMRNRARITAEANRLRADSTLQTGLADRWRRCWGPLYAMYEPRAWFWQPLVLVRRACFVLTAVLLAQQPGLRFMAFLFLNFGSLQLHAMLRPFSDPLINTAETGSYVLLVCVSALLTGYLPPYSLAVQVAVFLIVVPPACAWTVFTLRRECVGRVQAARKTRGAGKVDPAVDSSDAVELASAVAKPMGAPPASPSAFNHRDDRDGSQDQLGPSVAHGPSDADAAPIDLELNPLHRDLSYSLAMEAAAAESDDSAARQTAPGPHDGDDVAGANQQAL